MTIPRRTALTSAAALIASPWLSRPGAAQTGGFALAPSLDLDWAVHMDPVLGAGVTQDANGVTLKAAPYVYSGDADLLARSSVVIWSRTAWSGDFKVSFEFTRLDNTTKTTGTGIGAMLYFHATGAGTEDHPASFAEWPSARPSEDDYTQYGRGIRITWSNYNTVTPGNSNEMRLRSFEFTTAYPAKIGADSPAKFPFKRGVKYKMTFVRKGNKFSASVKDTTTGRTQSVSWSSTQIGRFSSGYFGIRHQPGREARYEKFSVTQP